MTQHLPTALPLNSASNLRDLGGWPTQDGRRVKTGLVFRAPALTNLSATDQAAVAALGIKITCDFRGCRAAAAGIGTTLGNHRCRATGITAYLKNGSTLEKAAAMANHASTRTTQLYDRRHDESSLDEVEQIRV